MTVELAPHSKGGLALASPLMLGSGAVGYGDAWPAGLTPAMFGAIVTPPLTLSARRGSPQPRLAEVPGGFILATGDHNPGLRRALEAHAAAWARLGVPVIAAFAASAPGDWVGLAEEVERSGSLAGLELHLPEDVNEREAASLAAGVRRATTLPLLARLPVTHAARLAHPMADCGVDSLVVGGSPWGRQLTEGGTAVEGPVAGAAAFPFTLRGLAAVAGLAPHMPLVAAGGIMSEDDARLCLEVGAAAVQLRELAWLDPAALARLTAVLGSDD